MNNQLTREQKVDLLGSVQLLKATGDCVVDLEELKEPLEW